MPGPSSGEPRGQKERNAQDSEDRGERDSPTPHAGLGMYKKEFMLAREIGALDPNREKRKCAIRGPAC